MGIPQVKLDLETDKSSSPFSMKFELSSFVILSGMMNLGFLEMYSESHFSYFDILKKYDSSETSLSL